MKLIIAHLPNDVFDVVRTELLDLGVVRTTISEVHCSGPMSAVTLQYRGAAVPTHLRTELRLECFVTAEQCAAVVDVLRVHACTSWGLGGRVAVLDLEELHEAASEDYRYPDDPRIEAVHH